MKVWRIASVLLLCLVLAGTSACSPFGGEEEETSQQLVEVVRGDLIISVSGSGSIGVSNEARLAFGIGGRVDKIYVKEGDRVSKGDVLAKLDTDALELALTQAQVALTQQQVAVTQAQVALKMAEYNLNQARDIYTWPEIKEAQADVDDAKAYVEYVSTNLDQATTAEKEAMWASALIYAQARLAAAEAKLDAMVRSYDTEEVAIKKLEVKLAEQSLELAKQSLEQSRQSLEQAQKQLDEATITAPFDGVVASVDADEGDSVTAMTRIVHLIDLTSMELSAEVDEVDVAKVEVGQRAIIEVDALPDLQLEGKVTSISLLPEVEAGLVVYRVKIGFDVSPDSEPKVGMSATVDIVIQKRSNVLLVPSRAITQDSQGNPIVKVMVNEQIEERPVVTGISDGIQTEIMDGLNEGDVVVVETRAKPSRSGGILF